MSTQIRAYYCEECNALEEVLTKDLLKPIKDFTITAYKCDTCESLFEDEEEANACCS